jgi:A/G-specific adenine glycosylase
MEHLTGIGPASQPWEGRILPLNYRCIFQVLFYINPPEDFSQHADTMSGMEITLEQALRLTSWFQKNQRILPWRNTGNPYDVWLSEIMLQQTRVEFVKERFLQFRKKLPDIASLAECEDDRLMKLWEGMGYYSRARNLKKCAQAVMQEYDGVLPADPCKLRKLPGIGPYTSGAIAAIAYGIPVPAVDGNVLRVLARLFSDPSDIRNPETRKSYESVISDFYENHLSEAEKADPAFVSHFTQGLMELGALICVPNGEPHCDSCPWKPFCTAHLENRTDEIPYRSALKERKVVKRTLFVIRDGERFLLRKRPAHGLLAGLYEFPGMDEWLDASQAAEAAEQQFHVMPLRIKRLPDSKHLFTHLEWDMRAFEIRIADLSTLKAENCLLLTEKELAETAVPSAFKAVKAWYSL